MKKVLAYCSAVLFSLMLAGCGSEATLDASSQEAMQVSAVKMMEQLPEAKQAEFQQALAGVVMMVGMKAAMQGQDQAAVQKAINEAVDGKTAGEVIELFKEKQAAMKNKG